MIDSKAALEFKLLGYEPLKEPKFKFLTVLSEKFYKLSKWIENKNRPKYDDDSPNIWIQENIHELLKVFSEQGHSGHSAPYCIDLFEKLANHKNLSPLTGEDCEWHDISEYCSSDGVKVYQNIRLSSVFKQSDIFDGQPYDINGKVFWEWYNWTDEDGNSGRSKSYYTCSDSRTPIIFPYIPPDKPEYIERESGCEK